jgi:hypothetical protein
VVSRFWAGFGQSISREAGQSSREDNQISGNLASGRGIFIYEFAELCDDYVIYFHAVDKFNFC